MAVFLVTACALSVWLERRASAFIQGRLGPNRVGPFGLLQLLADGIKFIFKEDLTPDNVNKVLYNLAPLMAFAPGFIAFTVIPFGTTAWGNPKAGLSVAHIDIGILFFLAVSPLTTYGLVYGGWSSYSKYSFLGALRGAAQIVTFEVAMSLVIVSVLISTGSTDLHVIVFQQAGTIWEFIPNWLIFRQPLAFFLFMVTAFAETNRLPFDLPEAESEIVGGYHTEYSGLKFALFFLGEYAAMITMSAIIVTLFLGGWYFPGVETIFTGTTEIMIASIVIFLMKLGFMVFFFIWVRWTLPRVRWDQLMKSGWKVLIPLALFNIILSGLLK